MYHSDDMIFVLTQIASDYGGMTAEMISGLLYFRDLNPTASPEVLATIIDRKILEHHIESGYDIEDYDNDKVDLVISYLRILVEYLQFKELTFWDEVYYCYLYESGNTPWLNDVWEAYMTVMEGLL